MGKDIAKYFKLPSHELLLIAFVDQQCFEVVTKITTLKRWLEVCDSW